MKRHFSERIVWEADRSVASVVRRAVSGRGDALVRANDVAATAIAVEGSRVLVRLDAYPRGPSRVDGAGERGTRRRVGGRGRHSRGAQLPRARGRRARGRARPRRVGRDALGTCAHGRAGAARARAGARPPRAWRSGTPADVAQHAGGGGAEAAGMRGCGECGNERTASGSSRAPEAVPSSTSPIPSFLTDSPHSGHHERPPHRAVGEPGEAAVAEDDEEADQRERLHLGARDLHHLAAHERVRACA